MHAHDCVNAQLKLQLKVLAVHFANKFLIASAACDSSPATEQNIIISLCDFASEVSSEFLPALCNVVLRWCSCLVSWSGQRSLHSRKSSWRICSNRGRQNTTSAIYVQCCPQVVQLPCMLVSPKMPAQQQATYKLMLHVHSYASLGSGFALCCVIGMQTMASQTCMHNFITNNWQMDQTLHACCGTDRCSQHH